MYVADESFYSTLATVGTTESGEIVQDVNKNTSHGQVSISSMFYLQFLCAKIPIAQKDSQVIIVFLHFWDLHM